MPYQQISYEVSQRVLTLTLNRPEAMNAFTRAMADELVDAFGRADGDDEVRAVILTGAGRAFCAGMDLGKGARAFDYAEDTLETHVDEGGLVTLRMYDMKKPVIVAFNGAAVGIGVTMTLPADIRLAAENARFGFVFTRRGIVNEACSSWFLPRLVGISRAAEWVLTGRVFPAAEALAHGLVSEVLAPERLLPRAREIAVDIAENTAPVSVALVRQLMWKMLGAGHPREAHKLESMGMYWTGKGADAAEGIASFLEKRPARFPSRVSADMPPFYPWW